MTSAAFRRMMAIRSVPAHIIVLTALTSYGAQLAAIIQGWPLWAIALATIVPWVPIFLSELVWAQRHYQWLALFYVIVVTQGGHVVEHVSQMVQIHLMGLEGAEASGVFGALGIEWVHFVWNTLVLVTVGVLLYRFRRNPWLWVTLVVAAWHEAEHLYIISVYLRTGVERTPGLLSSGGVIGGGLPLKRPDMHFLYNIVETLPLLAAFVYQLRHTYDEWLALARALPHLGEAQLVNATSRADVLSFGAGQRVVRQGDPADRFFIITRGQVNVTREGDGADDVLVATLGPGQFFGEIGLLASVPRTATVTAMTPVELLALDRDTFRALVQDSAATAWQLTQAALRRVPPPQA